MNLTGLTIKKEEIGNLEMLHASVSISLVLFCVEINQKFTK
jgi:hypothetical protein